MATGWTYGKNHKWAASTKEEDEDIAVAIRASLGFEDVSKIGNGSQSDGTQQEHGNPLDELCDSQPPATHAKEKEAHGTVRKDSILESRIADMATNLALEMPLLSETDGDTYVYIDPPPQQPEQNYISYRTYAARYAAPMRVHRNKFLELDSPFFEKAFGPNAQRNFMRRRGLVGKLPEGIKYVLDLTPPTEGEEAVYLTTELCCSEGVRKWFMEGARWNISKTLIGGREEYGPLPQRSNLPLQLTSATGTEKDKDVEEATMIPLEYSPIRHRCAIERVLRAIEGHDPQLDSAPKVWTTFAVAKHFEITHSLLTDYIVRWLRAAPNTHFLEVMPEVSLKIANGLQCYDLCRDMYAILVGEEALGNVFRAWNLPAVSKTHNVHGRKRDSLPDDYQRYIEYASKVFVERIFAVSKDLAGTDMNWLDDMPEVAKLDPPETPEDRIALEGFQNMLKDYVRGAIYHVLCASERALMPPDCDPHDLFPRVPASQTFHRLHPQERIFTRTFWLALKQCNWKKVHSNFEVGWRSHPEENKWTDAARDWLQRGVFKKIYTSDLERELRKCLKFRHQAESKLHGDSGPAEESAPISPKRKASGEESLPRGIPTDKQRRLSKNPPLPIHPPDSSSSASQVYANQATSLPFRTVNSLDIVNTKVATQENLKGQVLSEIAHKGIISEHNLAATATSPIDSDHISSSRSARPDDGNGADRGTDGSFSWELKDVFAWSPSQGTVEHSDLWNTQGIDFNLETLFQQIQGYVRALCERMLDSPNANRRSGILELSITDTLVCLEDSEWKYLPLWAGGNDDGSGGVFDDDVPVSETGFTTAGPNVHTGTGSSIFSDDFEMVGSHMSGSTYHTSTVVNDGYTDAMDRRRVIDNDSLFEEVRAKKQQDVLTEDTRFCDLDTMDSESMWDQVIVTPAEETETEDTKQPKEVDKGKGKMVQKDVTYDDVFAGESNDEETFEDDEDDFAHL